MTKRVFAVLLTAVLLTGTLAACQFFGTQTEEEQPSTTAAEGTTTTAAPVFPLCYVTATKLNVRSEPTTDSEVLGQLLYGDAVEILDTTDGWCRISYNGVNAYISAAYVSIQPPPGTTTAPPTTQAPTAAPTLPANATVYVTATKLNVRRNPAATGEVLGQLLYGTEVTALETVDGWCRIDFQGETAYVSADYVSLTPPSTTAASVTATTAD